MKFKLLAFVAASFVVIGNTAPAQTLQNLHSWSARPAFPVAGLCKGSDGNFYGTTESGGGEGTGTVFHVTPSGAGILQLLLRTGQTVAVDGANRRIKSFVALAPARGSLGAARGYDDQQHVTAVASLDDGTRAVIRVAVP